MRIWHYLLENILSAKTTFLNYTNVNSCFVNYYSHSITEVDLLYQLLDVFTVEISINGLKPRFLNLPYFDIIWSRIYVFSVILSINCTKSSKFMLFMKFLTFVRWPGIYVTLIHHGKSISWFSRHNILWWKRTIQAAVTNDQRTAL